MKMICRSTCYVLGITLLLFTGYSPRALFKKLSPNDQYIEKLKTAGPDRITTGSAWPSTAAGN
jgi:hypothetical protein